MAILPLQQPPQYATGMQSPLAAATEGLQLGAGLAQAQLAGEAQQQARQQNTQRQAALQQYMQNPTMQGLLQIAPMLPPEMVKNISEANKALSEEQRTNALQFGGTVLGFLEAGRTEDAVAVLRDRAAAYRNSGDQMNATALDRLVRIAEVDPNAAKAFVGVIMAAMPGGQTFIQGLAGIGGERRAQELQPGAVQSQQAALAKIYGDLDNATQRLGLDAEKARTDAALRYEELRRKGGELSGDAEKRRNDAVVSSITTGQMADQYGDLARQIEGVITQGGVPARISEASKRLLGTQNDITRLRTEYTRLKNAEVARIIPKPASDTDLKVFMEGFLDANANPEQLAAGLRSMSRLARIEAETKNMESEWISTFGGLQNAPRGGQIMGIEVRPGTSLRDFTRAFVTNRASQMAPRQESEAASGLLNRYGQ